MRGCRRASVGAFLALPLLAAGCGGQSAGPCDDAAFRAQDEEVYVAIATAQNAQAGGTTATVVQDLRRAAAALEGALETRPCDEKLAALADREREAAGHLDTAADRIEAGEDASEPLAAATATLTELEQTLFGPG